MASKGSNFVNDFNDLGSELSDLQVEFRVGTRTYEGTVIPEFSQELGENRFTVAVEIPETIALGEAEIVLIRPQKQRLGTNVDQYEIIELETERPIQLAPVCLEHILAAQESGDSLSVLNVSSTESVIQGSNSSDLLTAKIPVGTPDEVDKPVEVAATHNGTRAYVPLAQSGRVALVDLMTLRQVDTNPLTTAEIDPIDLPALAAPGAIAIHPTDKYAYIADSNSGAVYVLDIDPLSDAYNQVTETISLASATSGVAGIELSPDGRKLFVAAPGFPNSQIIVINTDLADRPSDESANTRRWHEPIGEISVPAWVQGITVAENSQQIAFTTLTDRYGFGAVEITNDDPLLFATREPKYASLSLGSFADYFDINRAVDVEVMANGDYAFVAAINNSSQTNVESIDGRRAGSNIGIIKDPFGPEPTLVAATRPIPGGLTTDLELSGGDRYLWASYPGLKLDSTEQGALLGFNVEEIVKAVENPGNFSLDSKQRGFGSYAFDASTQRPATVADLGSVPIDDINPDISTAADYQIVGGDWWVNFDFGVPDGSQKMPIAIGGTPNGLALSSAGANFVSLVSPSGDELNPTFQWQLHDDDDPDSICHIDAPEASDIESVKLFVSTFSSGQGLLPDDDWEGSKSSKEGDYNPNRILTATWNDGVWTWNGGRIAGSNTQFTLPDDRMLTAAQEYHWAVEVTTKNGSSQTVTEEFQTSLPEPATDNPFTSVTVLTPGIEVEPSESISDKIDAIARQLKDAGSSVLRYQPTTSQWQSVTYNPSFRDWVRNENQQQPVVGKPLVLLADWIDGIEPVKLLNGGFAEAAADAMFASLVQLDNGTVGGTNGLYDADGNLIRQQGDIFNSPLHFVGIGQGAVVNTEMIQRLGTYFPNAGGVDASSRDLQMTTVDPYDYDDNFQIGIFRNIRDPEVVVWDNVTYADNYYQLQGLGNTLTGRELSGDNWTADWNVDLSELAGFDQNPDTGAPHAAALKWYAGTANLQLGEGIYRRLGDLSEDELPWYVPDGTNVDFSPKDSSAPWEGIGTGWAHSILGGGDELRPYNVNANHTNNRLSVNFDNTYTNDSLGTRLRGDYAVPTLFNGNFDAISFQRKSQNIPGWNNATQASLYEWHQIPSLIDSGYLDSIGYDENQPNYTLVMGKQGIDRIVHNPFVVPDWGDLRFNLHAPYKNSGKLKVWLETPPTNPQRIQWNTHLLKEIDLAQTAKGELNTYQSDIDKIGFGRNGFETFHVPSQLLNKFRGQIARLRFEVEGNTQVFLDDVFFKSVHLQFGNPSEARYDSRQPNQNPYRENLLLEKPQYAVSYNRTTKIPNWVSWQVNKSWMGGQRSAGDFVVDPTLPNGWPQISGSNYVNNQGRSYGFNKGHTIPSRDRTRDDKDNIATFLGTNLIPQNVDNNAFFGDGNNPAEGSAWHNIEQLVTKLAENDKELYVIAGNYGTNWEPQKKSNALPNDSRYQGLTNSQAFQQQGIHIPTWTWKTMLVLEPSAPGVLDVTKDSRVYTFLTPNRAEPSAQDWIDAGQEGIEHPFSEIATKLQLNRFVEPIKNVTEWRDPQTWLVTIEELQNLLQGKNINFFSNVPKEIMDVIKQQIYFPSL